MFAYLHINIRWICFYSYIQRSILKCDICHCFGLLDLQILLSRESPGLDWNWICYRRWLSIDALLHFLKSCTKLLSLFVKDMNLNLEFWCHLPVLNHKHDMEQACKLMGRCSHACPQPFLLGASSWLQVLRSLLFFLSAWLWLHFLPKRTGCPDPSHQLPQTSLSLLSASHPRTLDPSTLFCFYAQPTVYILK